MLSKCSVSIAIDVLFFAVEGSGLAQVDIHDTRQRHLADKLGMTIHCSKYAERLRVAISATYATIVLEPG